MNWGRMYSLWPVHLETACCVPPDTVLLGGNKTISDYRVGDEVASAGGIAGVTQTFARGFKGNLIRIQGRGMVPFLVTPEHPILTVERRVHGGKAAYAGANVWKEAGNLIATLCMDNDGRSSLSRGVQDCLLIPKNKRTADSKTIHVEEYRRPHALKIAEERRAKARKKFPLTVDTAWLLGVNVGGGRSLPRQEVRLSIGHWKDALVQRVSRIVRSLGCAPSITTRRAGTLSKFNVRPKTRG